MVEDKVWEYAEDLRSYANHLCHDHHDAEDVAHNALLKAVQSKGGAFRAEASVRTWLHTIATNECRMLHRRPPSDSLDALLKDEFVPRTTEPLDSPNPEDAALAAEAARLVLAILRRLPDNYQRVLLLKDGCGMRTAEVAELLDATVGATKSRLYRARKSLRSEMALSSSRRQPGPPQKERVR